jgi:hypothetical protein
MRGSASAIAAPDTMLEGTSDYFAFGLSPMAGWNEAEALTRQAVPGSQPQYARVRIHDVMEAALKASGFTIQPLTPERQAVSVTGPTLWRWSITATKSGRQPLNFSLHAVLEKEGSTVPLTLRTFEHTVVVTVRSIAWYESVLAFVSKNWTWFVGSSLFAVIGGIWRAIVWWRKRRKPAAPENPPPKPGFE